ncbi:hypothetical protein [Pantoea agglomerans]|uniref:hypothetical protein n=1 Tax=Enterobacter agglomerans TaxID=549 RepID=UPI003C7D3F0C
MKDYELGYTPKNLRLILSENGLAQKDAYELIGKSRGVFSKYLLPADDKNHVSMSYRDWLILTNYISQLEKE